MKNVKMKNVKKIILDTNFLVDMFRFKLDFNEIEDVVGAKCVFMIAQQSVDELEKIKSKYAKVGLSFIGSEKIKLVSAPGRTVDDAIMSLLKNAKRKKEIKEIVVATNDARLRKRIKVLGVKVIYLRARKHLEIIN